MFDFEILNKLFFLKLVVNLAGLFFLIRPALGKNTFCRESAFIYYMFGVGVFLVTYSLKIVDISLGFAFGLFAIFSMLRYRTEVISIRQMTYLFLVIVVSLLCAVSPLSILELLAVVIFVALTAFLLESPLITKEPYGRQTVRYEKIENIKPENRQALLDDLSSRMGLDIKSVTITSVDFMQDSAMLSIEYGQESAPKEDAIRSPAIHYGIEDVS